MWNPLGHQPYEEKFRFGRVEGVIMRGTGLLSLFRVCVGKADITGRERERERERERDMLAHSSSARKG